MKKVSPKEMAEQVGRMIEVMEYAKNHRVSVGLPKEKVGGKVYRDGMTIIQIGAIHEYGAPAAGVPQRSFLRAPFTNNAARIEARIQAEFSAAMDGRRSPADALARVGIEAMNISRSSFRTRGDGEWPDLKPATVRRKGVDTPLVDSGTLRGSINYVVRRNAA